MRRANLHARALAADHRGLHHEDDHPAAAGDPEAGVLKHFVTEYTRGCPVLLTGLA